MTQIKRMEIQQHGLRRWSSWKQAVEVLYIPVRWFFFFLFVFSLGISLRAQNSSTSRIYGTVMDTSGAVVADAKVEVRSLATGVVIAGATNNSGLYVITGLKPGAYTVTISRSGYKTVKHDNIQIELDQAARLDETLTVGEFKEVVEVSAAPPLIETESSQNEAVFNEQVTASLPLLGRDPTQLAALAPATSTSQSQIIGTGTGGYIDPGRVNVGGSRAFAINATVDGGSVILPASNNFGDLTPAVGALSEFSVIQNNFGPQYGNGSSVLNMVMKSGANRFHGMVFEYLENDLLNARSRFSLTKSKLRYNQPGGTIGGPILKNKLFFFLSYQNTIVPSSTTSVVTVPTTAALSGDLSAYIGMAVIFDPTTGQPFPNNKIDSSRIDSVAANVVKYWPAPNGTGLSNNYTSEVYGTQTTPTYDSREDWTINSKHAFTYSMHEEVESTDKNGYIPGPACYGTEVCGTSMEHEHFYNLSERWLARPNMVNVVQFTYLREHYANIPSSMNGDYLSKMGLSANGISQVLFPTFSFDGAVNTSLGPGSQYAGTQNNFTYADTLTWLVNKHTLTLGAQLIKSQYNTTISYGSPAFAFTGNFTCQVINGSYCNTDYNGVTTGIGFADFLLGDVGEYNFSQSTIAPEARRHPLALFVGDTWKATNKLTVNLGMRYQREDAFVEKENRTSNFSPTTTNPDTGTLGAIVYATSSHPNMQKNHSTLFAPRFGVAYAAPHNTSVRASYGLFFMPLGAGTNFNASPDGYSINQSLIAETVTSAPVFQLKDGPPAYTLPSASNRTGAISNGTATKWWPYDAAMAYMHQWFLSVQKQICSQTSVEVNYVGSRGTHLISYRNYNQVKESLLGTAEDISDPQSIRPFPQYLGITWAANDNWSLYNALEAKLNRRFANGLTLMANYTWSQSRDSNSMDPTTQTGNDWQNAYDVQAANGLSQFDLRQRLVFAYVYDLPWGKGQRFLNNRSIFSAILGGWRNSGNFQVSTGFPFTVHASKDTSGSLSIGNLWANKVGSGSNPHTAAEWFNTSNYADPSAYTFGNMTRDSIRGPGYWDYDTSIVRSFDLPKSVKLQVRGDIFNLFNHPNLSQPTVTLGSASTGTITSASTPREFEVGGQFVF